MPRLRASGVGPCGDSRRRTRRAAAHDHVVGGIRGCPKRQAARGGVVRVGKGHVPVRRSDGSGSRFQGRQTFEVGPTPVAEQHGLPLSHQIQYVCEPVDDVIRAEAVQDIDFCIRDFRIRNLAREPGGISIRNRSIAGSRRRVGDLRVDEPDPLRFGLCALRRVRGLDRDDTTKNCWSIPLRLIARLLDDMHPRSTGTPASPGGFRPTLCRTIHRASANPKAGNRGEVLHQISNEDIIDLAGVRRIVHRPRVVELRAWRARFANDRGRPAPRTTGVRRASVPGRRPGPDGRQTSGRGSRIGAGGGQRRGIHGLKGRRGRLELKSDPKLSLT